MPHKHTSKHPEPVHSEKSESALGTPTSTFVSTGGRNRRWLLWVVIGVVVLALISGGVFLITRDREPDRPKEAVTEEGVVLKQLNSQQLRDELQRLLFQKKFSSAEQLIDFQDGDNDEHKMLLAVTYMNQNKPQDALRVLKEVEQHDQDNWQLANTIAGVYQQLGDKQNAIVYYKKALSLLKKTNDSPVQGDDIHFLERAITDLGGQP